MSSAVNTRHACILVAEDTDSNFDLLEAILGKEHRIIRAHDGMEVVTMFDEVKPDLILMDIKMPNLDGLEATKSFGSCLPLFLSLLKVPLPMSRTGKRRKRQDAMIYS